MLNLENIYNKNKMRKAILLRPIKKLMLTVLLIIMFAFISISDNKENLPILLHLTNFDVSNISIEKKELNRASHHTTYNLWLNSKMNEETKISFHYKLHFFDGTNKNAVYNYIDGIVDRNISTLKILNEDEWKCDEAYSIYLLDEKFVGGNSNPNYIFLIKEDKLIEFSYTRPLTFTEAMKDEISNGFIYSLEDFNKE